MAVSKEDPKGLSTKSTNPKDILGVNRTPLWLIPGPAKIHQALAHLDGAKKYGPYNWRTEGVCASIYISGIGRHLDDYLDGEDYAHDSQVHHLGHLIAGANIILDSLAQGNFIDDRPPPAPTAQMHEQTKLWLSGKAPNYDLLAELDRVAPDRPTRFASDEALLAEVKARGLADV